MDTILIKDILMFTVALYGATLATFTYRRGKPKFEIDYSVVLMALADGPADALKLTILNTGQTSCFVEGFGVVGEDGKFLDLELISQVNRRLQADFKGNTLSGFTATNQKFNLLHEDREVKPNSTSVAFLSLKEQKELLDSNKSKKLFIFFESAKVMKKKEIDFKDLKFCKT